MLSMITRVDGVCPDHEPSSHDYGRKSSNLNPHALSELDIIVVLVGKSWPKCIVEAITSNNK